MKIVFLNVWEGSLREDLRDFLRAHSSGVDVFCFQEGGGPKMESIYNELSSDFQIIRAIKQDGSNGHYQQIVLVKKDIKVIDSFSLAQSDSELGLALVVKLEIDGRSLYILNNHGVPQPGDKLDTPERIRQCQTLVDFARSVDEPIIIGGDFNLLPETDSIKMFEHAGYEDLIKKYEIATTRNHYVWDRYPDNKQSFADYIFVSPEITVDNFEVPDIEISDHLPLKLDFELVLKQQAARINL